MLRLRLKLLNETSNLHNCGVISIWRGVRQTSRVFGASAHQFLLNPAMTDGEVTEFERMHGIALPPDYRYFLSLVVTAVLDDTTGSSRLGEIDDGFDFERSGEGYEPSHSMSGEKRWKTMILT